MGKSTPSASGRKPRKPRPKFPLYRHRAGHWAKKVRGRTRYFGRIDGDPNGTAALERWLKEKDDLLAGREPGTASTEAKTVRDICNAYLTHKKFLRTSRQITPRTFLDYYATCENLVRVFGPNRAGVDLGPSDFAHLAAEIATTRKLVALRNEIGRVRSVFLFAFNNELIPKPTKFGSGFAKPSKRVIDREKEENRATNGERMFEATELRSMLAAATQPLKAMILLGINCGFGQSDISSLPRLAVDLERGWIDYARPKTTVRRRCALWPETAEAIKEWLTVRPTPKDKADEGLLFVTCFGQRWVKVNEGGKNQNGTPVDAVAGEFGKLIGRLKLTRPGRGFYALRHGFETIAGETADQVAVDAVMGHVTAGMSSVYRERIPSDDRLRRVAEHVRSWLFG